MTQPLSLAGKAVMDAVVKVYPAFPDEVAATAIRAAANLVVPEQPHEDTFEYCCDYAQSREKISIRTKLLAIADELDAFKA